MKISHDYENSFLDKAKKQNFVHFTHVFLLIFERTSVSFFLFFRRRKDSNSDRKIRIQSGDQWCAK